MSGRSAGCARCWKVSRSGFHAWPTRPLGDRAILHAKRVAATERRFEASDRTCGAHRVWHDVLMGGLICGPHRIERPMRRNALKARPKRRGKPQDDCKRPVIAHNILDRDFEADRPNQKRLADVTCIWTARGWLHVAVVPDLFSRVRPRQRGSDRWRPCRQLLDPMARPWLTVGWPMKAERDAHWSLTP